MSASSMDRRGFLKAMLVLAGAAVLPSVLVEPVRAKIAAPCKVKPKPIVGEWGYFNTRPRWIDDDPQTFIVDSLSEKVRGRVDPATGVHYGTLAYALTYPGPRHVIMRAKGRIHFQQPVAVDSPFCHIQGGL